MLCFVALLSFGCVELMQRINVYKHSRLVHPNSLVLVKRQYGLEMQTELWTAVGLGCLLFLRISAVPGCPSMTVRLPAHKHNDRFQ